MINDLTLRVVVPGSGESGEMPEVRAAIDGGDLLADADFTEGPGTDPTDLLRPGGPLAPTAEPHEVRLASADCTEECCGAVYVTVRVDGGHVVWDGWRNPAASLDRPALRFDAEAYRREVDRATADLSWEWPACTVARLLRERLTGRPDWPARWRCDLTAVVAWPWQPHEVKLFFLEPGVAEVRAGRSYRQYLVSLPVTGDDPAVQAASLTELLLAGDPRQRGEICGSGGGSAAEPSRR